MIYKGSATTTFCRPSLFLYSLSHWTKGTCDCIVACRQEHGRGVARRVRIRVTTPCTRALTGAGTSRHTINCYPYPYPRKVFPWIHYTTCAPTYQQLPPTCVAHHCCRPQPLSKLAMGDTGTNILLPCCVLFADCVQLAVLPRLIASRRCHH